MRFVETEKLLSCVHCGLCLPSCPTYAELGTESDSPRGRILLMRSLEEGRLAPTDEVIAHLDGCLGCRACETACPSGVPYGSLIEAARPYLESRRSPTRRLARRALGALLTRRLPRRLTFSVVRALGGSRPAIALARALAATPFGPWLAYAAAAPPARPAAPLAARTEAEGAYRGTALYLTGCVAETLFPDTARATVALLARAGVRVLVPAEQGCCGALALHLGDASGAHSHARRLLGALDLHGVDWVLPSAAGCGAFLRELSQHLPGNPAAGALAERTRDPLSLLAELGLPPPRGRLDRTVAVHDPCHLVHAQGVRDEPRRLLRTVPGLTLVDLEESDFCCGSAGTYNVTEPAMAARLLDRKLERIVASGAEVVAAANPGCLLQIRAGAIARSLPVRVEHPLELLAAAHGLGGA
jgi:glycolate dehydrogenase iron-sulfur subunit